MEPRHRLYEGMIDSRLVIVAISEQPVVDAEKVLRLALDTVRCLRAIGREQRGRRAGKVPWCVEIEYRSGQPVIRQGLPGQPEGLEC